MLTPIFVIVGLAVLILGHEAGHFFAAKWMNMKVDEFGFGFPPRVWKRRQGETEYSFNLLPFGGYVKIAGENDRIMGDMEKLEALSPEEKKRLFFFQAPWRRSVVILSGVLANFLIGWLLFSAVFAIGTAPALVVYEVQAGSPAEQMGIKAGDIIVNFKTTEEFTAFGRAHAGEEINIQIKRQNEGLNFTVVPRVDPEPGQGAVGLVFAGIAPRGPLTALRDGFLTTVDMAKMTINGFYSLLKNLILTGTLPGEIVGPVGIFVIAQDAGQAGGLFYLLQLIAFISINLAVINLIPFPALDGGRFLLILLEKIKGSPIPRRAEAWINGVGFVLLLLLMLVVTVRDIIRL